MTDYLTSSNSNKRAHYATFLILILSGYVILQALVINSLPLAYEEGINIQLSRLMVQDYEPYTEIATLTGPLFVWGVKGLGSLSLTSVMGLKLSFLCFGLVLLLVTAAVTRLWFGDDVALATAFLLATATTFIVEAAAVVNVIPACAVAMSALWLTSRPGKVWRFAAGLVWAGALFISVSVIPMGLAALLLIVFPQTNDDNDALSRQELILAVIIWLAGAGVAIGLGWLLFGDELNQIFSSYATIRSHVPLSQSSNFVVIGRFLVYNLWLSGLAVYAIARVSSQARHRLWLVVMWLLFAFVWLMGQIPLRPADIAILLPPLAMLAGWGLADAGQRWLTYSQTRPHSSRIRQTGLVVALCFYLLVSWQRFQEHTLQDVDTGDDLLQIQQVEALAQFIQQHTNADECVIIDDPALAVVANRLPAPQLLGLSELWLVGGLVDLRQLTTLMTEGNCTAIVLSRREYHEYLLQFGGWLQESYPNSEQMIRTRVYFR